MNHTNKTTYLRRMISKHWQVVTVGLGVSAAFTLIAYEMSKTMKKENEMADEDEEDYSLLDMTLPPIQGNVYDDYVFQEEIGKGFSSVVFRAERDGKQYAIKKITKRIVSLKKFHSEISTLAGLDHPNVLKYYGYYDDNKDYYYVVTEYVSGGELFEKIVEKNVFTENESRLVLKTLAETIAYLHSRGIVHRGLKPENILLGSEDLRSIKLVDFGFAIKQKTKAPLKAKVGTPIYVAPEIITQSTYDYKVDCWSFGIIMFILLSGKLPFHNCESIEDTFEQIKKGVYFDPGIWGSKTPECVDLIKNILVLDPKYRFTMDDILHHPWMNEGVELSNITFVTESLGNFVVRKRVQRVIRSILVSNRISKARTSSTSSSSSSGTTQAKNSVKVI